MSSAYHHQTHGQTEVVNKFLEAYLRCFVIDKQNHWSQWLRLAEWWYNSTYNTYAKMTHFQTLYGYEPPNCKELVLKDTNVPKVRNQLEKSQKMIELLKDNLIMAHNCVRQQADHRRIEREFEVGD